MGKLCLLVCDNFKREAECVIQSEGYHDVEVKTFPATCDRPQVDWRALRQAGDQDPYSETHLLGGCCVAGADQPSGGTAQFRLHRLEQCSCLFAGAGLVRRYGREGAYLLTPGWLARWRQYVDAWGFNRDTAREFFGEFTRKVVLLDTGVDPGTAETLREFAEFLRLPSETSDIGLDFFRLFLSGLVSGWRWDREKSELRAALARTSRQAADNAMAFDLVATLTRPAGESQTIERMLEMFDQLFGPTRLVYLSLKDGEPGDVKALPRSAPADEAARGRLLGLRGEWAWSESGDGFLLRISHGDNTMGILEAGPFPLTQYKEDYLNVALNLSKVCGLAVYNARQFQELRELGDALRRNNAELEVANKELEAFSYSVSHDLRAPLRSAEGFSAALLEDYGDKLDGQGRDYLQRIGDSSVQMAQMIDDLLGLSLVTRKEMHWERVDLSKLATEVLERLRGTEPGRHVESTVAEGMTVQGDPGLLRIALENLLGNSWKFTGKSSQPKIEVGITERDGDRPYFVRDNGVGFEPAHANKLFKPFRRLHSTSEFPGTGIGLATVQRIIHRHGGTIWAEAAVGKGATFYFTLG